MKKITSSRVSDNLVSPLAGGDDLMLSSAFSTSWLISGIFSATATGLSFFGEPEISTDLLLCRRPMMVIENLDDYYKPKSVMACNLKKNFLLQLLLQKF